MKSLLLRTAAQCCSLVTFLFLHNQCIAENGGVAVQANARGIHEAVGATVWANGPHLIEPCTAILVCENVILTTAHCLNFNWIGTNYFTLVEDINALPGDGNRNQKLRTEFARAGQTRTARVHKDSVRYGPHQLYPGGFAGVAMARFVEGDRLNIRNWPNLVPQTFRPTADPLAFGPPIQDQGGLRPRAGHATDFFVSGYGFNDNRNDAAIGAALLRHGTMRFLSWMHPRTGGSAARPPANNDDIAGFVLELARAGTTPVHGCPGDSGGGMWTDIGKNDVRLAGIRDFITDRDCTAREPAFDDFTSLIFTQNRQFVSDFMAANCSDSRVINVNSGNNVPVRRPNTPPPPSSQSSEDLCPDDIEKTEPGECGCGIPDFDLDGGGVADCNDQCPYQPKKVTAGQCGCNESDADVDADGTVDCADGCPDDSLKLNPGVCGCGIADGDSDGDGIADCNDQCPFDPTKLEAGICGCGAQDTDTDGDGTADCNDGCPADNAKVAGGICGCGATDTDSDGDGTADCFDHCPLDGAKAEAGICGCGSADTDSDADGTSDCFDGCPRDYNKQDAGACGCGIFDVDTDSDGTPDCLDTCAAPDVAALEAADKLLEDETLDDGRMAKREALDTESSTTLAFESGPPPGTSGPTTLEFEPAEPGPLVPPNGEVPVPMRPEYSPSQGVIVPMRYLQMVEGNYDGAPVFIVPFLRTIMNDLQVQVWSTPPSSTTLQENRDFFWDNRAQIRIHQSGLPARWVRDFGPISGVNSDGELVMNLFHSAYGSTPDIWNPLTDLYRVPAKSIGLPLEGGNIMVNDDRVCMTTERAFTFANAILRAEDANRLLPSRQEVIDAIKTNIGCREVLVLPVLPYESTGQIDMWAKYVNNSTIFVHELRQNAIDAFESEFRDRLCPAGRNCDECLVAHELAIYRARLNRLKQALDEAAQRIAVYRPASLGPGFRSYTVVRVPMLIPLLAGSATERNTNVVYSYVNSLIVNRKVLIPDYQGNEHFVFSLQLGREVTSSPYPQAVFATNNNLMVAYQAEARNAFAGAGLEGVMESNFSKMFIYRGGAIHSATMQVPSGTLCGAPKLDEDGFACHLNTRREAEVLWRPYRRPPICSIAPNSGSPNSPPINSQEEQEIAILSCPEFLVSDEERSGLDDANYRVRARTQRSLSVRMYNYLDRERQRIFCAIERIDRAISPSNASTLTAEAQARLREARNGVVNRAMFQYEDGRVSGIPSEHVTASRLLPSGVSRESLFVVEYKAIEQWERNACTVSGVVCSDNRPNPLLGAIIPPEPLAYTCSAIGVDCRPSNIGACQPASAEWEVSAMPTCMTWTWGIEGGYFCRDAPAPDADACVEDPDKTLAGFCGCGISDQDSDGDGLPDCEDECAGDKNKYEPEACGCGIPDSDADHDGTEDCNDSCPSDPKKVEPGLCGCGIPDGDADGDHALCEVGISSELPGTTATN